MTPLAPESLLLLAPIAVLVLFGLLLILAESFASGSKRGFFMPLTVVGCICTAAVAFFLYKRLGPGSLSGFGGMLVGDRTGMFFIVLFSIVTAFAAMLIAGHQEEHRWRQGETYGVLMLVAAGMAMLAMAGNLVTVFIGVETMSIGVYVLVASRRFSKRSAEAAMKYFVMGAFASGFLLYGIALVYGATGTTDIAQIRAGMAQHASSPILIAGVFMLIVAFGFKIAAVPFQMWAPDAYEGAPTPITGFMAAAVKAAAFVGILRVFAEAFGGDMLPMGRMGWGSIFAIIAALTMTVGNMAALRQDNVKRMLAYSSISHAGVVLVGVVAVGYASGGVEIASARQSVLFYLAAYSFTTLGAFAVISWLGSRERERVLVDDFAGLAGAHPAAALAMTVFMLSLGGIPPTAGFMGKFLVFKSAMVAQDQALVWLVVIGVLNSIVSIFYYLRVVMAMYFRDPVGEFKVIRSGAMLFVIVVCAILAIQMGIMPGSWLAFAGV